MGEGMSIHKPHLVSYAGVALLEAQVTSGDSDHPCDAFY